MSEGRVLIITQNVSIELKQGYLLSYEGVLRLFLINKKKNSL